MLMAKIGFVKEFCGIPLNARANSLSELSCGYSGRKPFESKIIGKGNGEAPGLGRFGRSLTLPRGFLAADENSGRRQVQIPNESLQICARRKPNGKRIVVKKEAEGAKTAGSHPFRKIRDRKFLIGNGHFNKVRKPAVVWQAGQIQKPPVPEERTLSVLKASDRFEVACHLFNPRFGLVNFSIPVHGLRREARQRVHPQNL
jgi:hypothetical protein